MLCIFCAKRCAYHYMGGVVQRVILNGQSSAFTVFSPLMIINAKSGVGSVHSAK